jgi:rhamnogalacturonan II specific xylosyltransferase
VQRHHKTAGELKKDEFAKISKEMVGLDSFSFGKAATEFLLLLFGAPFCALVVKRVLPGLRGLSDDIVIPLATSGSVAYLVHTKKL